MNKKECIEIFNSMTNNIPVSFKDKLLPLVSDYLTEIKYEKSDKIISLIVNNPAIIQQAIPTIVDYYCKKYNIFILKQPIGLDLFKTLMYYD